MQKSNALKLSSSATIVGLPSPATPPVKISAPASVSGSASPALGSKAQSPPVPEDLTRRVAEAKRRVAEAQGRLAVKDNPYMVSKPYLQQLGR
jgi:U4/U6 small nuclear ribonucleoprotein PRP3